MKPDATIEQKLAQVRQLVKQKRISEARRILVEIDHPTAHLWLQRLHEVDENPSKKQPCPKHRRPARIILYVLMFTLCLNSLMLAVLLRRDYINRPYDPYSLTYTNDPRPYYETMEHRLKETQTTDANHIIATQTAQARINADATSLAIRRNRVLTVTAELSGGD